jgi:ribosomal protein L44E
MTITISIAMLLQCHACKRSDDLTTGWRMYRVEGRPTTTETFCPDCAERERGEDERPW